MNILEYAKFKQGILKECVLLEDNQAISGKKTLTDRLHTKDVYVGGYFDSNGNWKDSVDTSSSLRVSGTVELLGEVHADNTSFHTHHMDVGGELKVAGDAKFDHDVRMTHSLRVDSKADIREGATIRGTLDMKGNDVKNVQSLKVNGTLDTYNDIKMKPNTGREDRVKLSDALNEALGHTFKNRVQFYGNDANSSLSGALDVIANTSASIISFDVDEYEIVIPFTQPIDLSASVTFMGVKKNKTPLRFVYTGPEDADEVTVFRITNPLVSIGFKNVKITVEAPTNAEIALLRAIDDTVIDWTLDLDNYESGNSHKVYWYVTNCVVTIADSVTTYDVFEDYTEKYYRVTQLPKFTDMDAGKIVCVGNSGELVLSENLYEDGDEVSY